jgi:hypothetical protein
LLAVVQSEDSLVLFWQRVVKKKWAFFQATFCKTNFISNSIGAKYPKNEWRRWLL